jgi:ABC-type phosphate transport system substrate-binding protein
MTGHARHLTRCAVLLLDLLSCSGALAEDEIAVIVANEAPASSISPALVRDIYLKKRFIDDNGQPLIPVNLPPDNPLRLCLTETVFNKSAQQLQDYWNQRYFQGVTPPYVLRSQEAVVQFVAKTPGAIGYIAACRLDARVKQVLTISAPPALRPALAKLCPTGPNRSPTD